MSEVYEEKDKFLVYRIGDEYYASKLLDFVEVIEYTKPKIVPNMSACFSGMINLRGLIIGVVDLRKKLGIFEEFSGKPSMLICDTELGPIGAIIDKVEYVMPFSQSDIQDLKVERKMDKVYLKGFFQHQENLITVIEIKSFVSNFEENYNCQEKAA
jgi:purine-binding chemotaxis protein CheW